MYTCNSKSWETEVDYEPRLQSITLAKNDVKLTKLSKQTIEKYKQTLGRY